MATPSLSWSALVFGSIATEITGVGKSMDSRMIWFCFVAKRVAGIDVLQADAGANVARVDFLNFFALVGVHLEQTADALAGTLCGIHDIAARLQNARVDADVSDVADKGIGHDFEGQRSKRLIVSRDGEEPFRRFPDWCLRPAEHRSARAGNRPRHRARAEYPYS